MLDKTATLDVASEITFEQLPGAHFFSQAAVFACGYEATRYEGAVYELTGDGIALWEDLGSLGYDAREIHWHADNPGRRMERG
jgi:hypothetical protein